MVLTFIELGQNLGIPVPERLKSDRNTHRHKQPNTESESRLETLEPATEDKQAQQIIYCTVVQIITRWIFD